MGFKRDRVGQYVVKTI